VSGTLVGLLLLAQAGIAAPDALQRIRSRIAVVLVEASVREVAGKYTSASDELASHWGGGGHLSGRELHLFPDGTYVYCEWADIEPLTVYDKGAWHLDMSVVGLVSDPEVTWGPEAERRYLAVRRPGRKSDALLVGMERALSDFETEATDDPGFSLLLVGLLRTARYDPGKTGRIKAKLLEVGWKPGYLARSQ